MTKITTTSSADQDTMRTALSVAVANRDALVASALARCIASDARIKSKNPYHPIARDIDVISEIAAAKARAGSGAFIWLHDSGDCILWPDESSSVDDDGRNAIGRWQLSRAAYDAMLASGLVDELA